MKTKIFLFIIGALLPLTTQAQFVDDMEYDSGEPLEAWWVDNGPDGIDIISSFACNGTRSGYIGGGATDQVLDLGGRTVGEWGISFCMYIPPSKGGYFTLLGDLNVGNGEFLIGNFYFNSGGANPGVGQIENSTIGLFEFDYPEGAWFQVILNFDLTGGMAAATWDFFVYEDQVLPPGTPFTAWNGDVPSQLGGFDFFSIDGNNQNYFDSFRFEANPILAVAETTSKSFYIYPNPTSDVVRIASEETIIDLRLFSFQGTLLFEQEFNETIDLAGYASGVYFLEIKGEFGSSFQKIIKK